MANLSVLCKLLHVAVSPRDGKPAGGLVVHVPLPHATIPTHAPGVGDVNFTVTAVSAKADLDGCSATGGNGAFDLDAAFTVNLTEIAFEYSGSAWPHIHNVGSADGQMSFDANISFDVKSSSSQFDFRLAKPLDIHLHQEKHDWVTDAISHVIKMEQSKIADKVTEAGRKALQKQVIVARDQGACALLEPLHTLPVNEAEVALKTPPKPVHLPTVGMVNVSLNSTKFYPVQTFGCQHMGFDGRTLDTKLDEAIFFGFNWTAASKKVHNSGTGVAHVNASVHLKVDLVSGASKVYIDLPGFDIHLDAAKHDWLYHALLDVAVPSAREGIEHYGSRKLSAALSKCLEDPACPAPARPSQPLLARAAARAFEPEILTV